MKSMCIDLFSEETPSGSILVSDHLPYGTTQSLHFGWPLTGGSTVVFARISMAVIFVFFLAICVLEKLVNSTLRV